MTDGKQGTQTAYSEGNDTEPYKTITQKSENTDDKQKDYFYLSKLIYAQNPDKKFISGDYGLSSTERKNINRVCKVLEALYCLNNNNLKEGYKFFDNLKYAIIDFMDMNDYEFFISNDKVKFKRKKTK